MPALSPETLDRISRAARCNEYLHLDEDVLWLPIVSGEPPTTSFLSWVDQGITRKIFEDAFGEVASPQGALVLSADMAYREVEGQWQQQPLPARAPVRVEHNGYSAEAYYQPLRFWFWQDPKWELLNRIQVGEWPADGVIVRGRPEQQRLIQLLRRWYERGVPVREWYQGRRTFLLNPHMSDKQIQAFRQQYGVRLDG